MFHIGLFDLSIPFFTAFFFLALTGDRTGSFESLDPSSYLGAHFDNARESN